MNTQTTTREEMLAQIKSRFIIIVVISVLFSTALASLYQLTGDTSGDLVFWGTLVPAMYLIAYVLYELCNKRIATFIIDIIRFGLLLCIGVFVFPVTIISFYKTGMVLGFAMKALLYISIYGIPFLSVLFVLVVLAGILSSFEKIGPVRLRRSAEEA